MARDKIFKDKVKLNEMIALFLTGKWSFLRLGKKYQCDHTSIIYQVRKHTNIRAMPRQRKMITESIPLTILPSELRRHNYQKPIKRKTDFSHVDEFGERLNPGKTYKQYLRTAKILGNFRPSLLR